MPERPEERGTVWLFTYGLLRDPDLMRRLLGFVPERRRARVHGYRRRFSSRSGYYYLTPDPEAVAEGVAWRLPEAALPVLDDFEDVETGQYRRTCVEITLDDGRRVRGYAYEGAAIAEAAGPAARDR